MGKLLYDGSKTQDSKPGKESKDVAETSKSHYQEMIESGQLGSQCETVLRGVDAMKVLPTIDELSKEALAGWEKSSISGRLNDLKDKGLVTDLGGDAKRKSQYSGVTSKVWSVTDKGEEYLNQEVEKE